MVISPRGLLGDVGQRFSDTARSALPSVAEPAWFAPPLDVRGDAESVTIVFRVPEDAAAVRVESAGSSVVLRARLPARSRAALRVFALPFEAPRGSIKTTRKGDVVEVRIRRLHPDARMLARGSEEAEGTAP